MAVIQNPILKGFNPDPSILRVNEDYYIATSTFEWFPGVQIHHSKDLAHWDLIAHPLNRPSQLNMLGNPSSGGVWAPCLSYSDGLFYLIFSDVKSLFGKFKDTPNFLVTASDICGEWSDPIYLNASGFDPSLFHDTDGRKWLVNMVNDCRPWKGTSGFGGIYLQEYSVAEQKLIGTPKNIFAGTELGLTEGPHLYHHGEYYYLMTAEGGTGFDHAVTLARSKNIDGPYEVSPKNPILTSRENSELALQKAGHASLVDTPQGEWFLAHLCSRPIGQDRRCILGRETAIQAVEWTNDGWLYLKSGGNEPQEFTEVPYKVTVETSKEEFFDDFDSEKLNIHFQTLRAPLMEDECSLTQRQGYLRLFGGESLSSCFHQSLVARRQQHKNFTAITNVDFAPDTFQQTAGLIYYYDHINYYYLHVSYDEDHGRTVNLLFNKLNQEDYPVGMGIAVPTDATIYLKLDVQTQVGQFSYSLDGKTYQPIGDSIDATILSDDAYGQIGQYRFTGAFVGVCCQDLSGRRHPADFDFFSYTEN